jgi:hypothetical protein
LKRTLICLIVLAASTGGALRAQDITAPWQGTLHTDKDLAWSSSSPKMMHA